MREILKVSNISKTFKLSAKQQRIEKTKEKVKVAVNDLSFSAYDGEIFGLLGPNGAGKTTTLRVIATLIKPDSGDVILNGESVIKNPEKVRSMIGFLTSELKLEDFFTPDYLFEFFSELYHVPHETMILRKNSLFKRFGIDEFANVKVANLSSGMKQKLSLAISLVHDPEVIIFDEPTNGLDVLTAKVVTDFLLELRDSGKTVILSTHIFSLVEKTCDRVAIIIDGKLAACGSLEEIKDGLDLEDRFFHIYSEMVGETNEK